MASLDQGEHPIVELAQYVDRAVALLPKLDLDVNSCAERLEAASALAQAMIRARAFIAGQAAMVDLARPWAAGSEQRPDSDYVNVYVRLGDLRDLLATADALRAGR